MSVIVRDEDGQIFVFCKGADRFATNLGLSSIHTHTHKNMENPKKRKENYEGLEEFVLFAVPCLRKGVLSVLIFFPAFIVMLALELN